MLKILDIVGARPQFIKLGPVLRAIESHNSEEQVKPIEEVLVHTGQHYDKEMSNVFFDQLEIKEPDYNLGVGSGPQGQQTGEMLKRAEEVLKKEQPDIAIVYGDTNSTLAGALAAAKLNIPLAHIEAGLRSYNKEMPEEINRVLTDHASNFLFCPTKLAAENLRDEGFTNVIDEGNRVDTEYIQVQELAEYVNNPMNVSQVVSNVGDVMYDAALQNIEYAKKKSSILNNKGLEKGEYALATVHRAGNTNSLEKLENIFNALEWISRNKVEVVLPIHPRTKDIIEKHNLSFDGINIIPPVPYLDMLQLEKNASVILTDSGGVQKEAYFYRVPCITMREETEWIQTVEAGWNHIVGSNKQEIIEAFKNVNVVSEERNYYGHGEASKMILKLIKSSFRITN